MDALVVALLNTLWQGAALIALVTLVMRAGARRNATTACVVWSIAFVTVALLPALDLALARTPGKPAAEAAPVLYRVALMTNAIRLPANAGAASARQRVVVTTNAASSSAAAVRRAASGANASAQHGSRTFVVVRELDVRAPRPAPAPPADRIERVRAAFSAALDAARTRAGRAASTFARSWGTAIVALWLAIATVLLARLAFAYRSVLRVKRTAVPIADATIAARLRAAGHRRVAVVAASDAVDVPCAIGFRRPMILLPSSLVVTLDADDLARVVLHESAHLQRYDDWTNALEQVVCALQFFQPALHIARRGIDFEREVACDDRVLADAGEPIRYAECLARIVQGRAGARTAFVPGFVLRKPQVVARVHRIVDRSRDASPHVRAGAAAFLAAAMIATTGMAELQVPLVAAASASTGDVPRDAAPHAAPLFVAKAVPLAVPHAAPHASPHVASATRPLARRANVAPHARLAKVAPLPRLAKVAPLPPLAKVVPLPQFAKVALRPQLAKAAPLRRLLKVAPLPALAKAAALPRLRKVAPLPPLAKVAPLPPRANAGPLPKVAPPAMIVTTEARVVALNTDGHGFAYEIASDAPSAPASPCPSPAAAARAQVLEEEAARAHALAGIAKGLADTEGRAHVFITRDAQDANAANLARVRAQLFAEQGRVFVLRGRNDGDLLDAIDQAKYPRASVDDLIALRNAGVTGNYVRTMGALGPNRPSLHDLIPLATQGVPASWLDGVMRAGYPRLTTADAIALWTQGVSVAFVRGLTDAGVRNLTPAQIIALRLQGVDGTFVKRLASHGYKNLGVDDLIRLRASGLNP